MTKVQRWLLLSLKTCTEWPHVLAFIQLQETQIQLTSPAEVVQAHLLPPTPERMTEVLGIILPLAPRHD